MNLRRKLNVRPMASELQRNHALTSAPSSSSNVIAHSTGTGSGGWPSTDSGSAVERIGVKRGNVDLLAH